MQGQIVKQTNTVDWIKRNEREKMTNFARVMLNAAKKVEASQSK